MFKFMGMESINVKDVNVPHIQQEVGFLHVQDTPLLKQDYTFRIEKTTTQVNKFHFFFFYFFLIISSFFLVKIGKN